MRKVFEKKWSADVRTKWSPPEGFFKQSASKIATELMAVSKDRGQAMSRLNFYINRAGENLSDDDRKRLESVKSKLQENKSVDSIISMRDDLLT
jgi:hypothetical protein